MTDLKNVGSVKLRGSIRLPTDAEVSATVLAQTKRETAKIFKREDGCGERQWDADDPVPSGDHTGERKRSPRSPAIRRGCSPSALIIQSSWLFAGYFEKDNLQTETAPRGLHR